MGSGTGGETESKEWFLQKGYSAAQVSHLAPWQQRGGLCMLSVLVQNGKSIGIIQNLGLPKVHNLDPGSFFFCHLLQHYRKSARDEEV